MAEREEQARSAVLLQCSPDGPDELRRAFWLLAWEIFFQHLKVYLAPC
jgi:hypothetical protein